MTELTAVEAPEDDGSILAAVRGAHEAHRKELAARDAALDLAATQVNQSFNEHISMAMSVYYEMTARAYAAGFTSADIAAAINDTPTG